MLHIGRQTGGAKLVEHAVVASKMGPDRFRSITLYWLVYAVLQPRPQTLAAR